MNCSKSLEQHYMFYTTLVAALTAITNLTIIFCMNSDNLDRGLGLAAIGIITFFGVSLSSSIFEKYKDKTESGTQLHESTISRVVIGQGIMRKGLAASLVMTYIVLIGLSFTAGTLDNSLNGAGDIQNSTIVLPNNSSILSNSQDVNTNIVIKDIVRFDSIQIKEMNPDSKNIEELILTKEPDTLVEHFTMVISVVIGFYFGVNTLYALIKTRQENKSLDKSLEILKIRLAKGEISENDYKKLKNLIKE